MCRCWQDCCSRPLITDELIEVKISSVGSNPRRPLVVLAFPGRRIRVVFVRVLRDLCALFPGDSQTASLACSFIDGETCFFCLFHGIAVYNSCICSLSSYGCGRIFPKCYLGPITPVLEYTLFLSLIYGCPVAVAAFRVSWYDRLS